MINDLSIVTRFLVYTFDIPTSNVIVEYKKFGGHFLFFVL